MKLVAYGMQCIDGSLSKVIVPVDYPDFDKLYAELLENDSWVKHGTARIVPLYIAEPLYPEQKP